MRIMATRAEILLLESWLLLATLVIMVFSRPYFATGHRIIEEATELLSARKTPGTPTTSPYNKPFARIETTGKNIVTGRVF
jgi:hypothetical protein